MQQPTNSTSWFIIIMRNPNSMAVEMVHITTNNKQQPTLMHTWNKISGKNTRVYHNSMLHVHQQCSSSNKQFQLESFTQHGKQHVFHATTTWTTNQHNHGNFWVLKQQGMRIQCSSLTFSKFPARSKYHQTSQTTCHGVHLTKYIINTNINFINSS